MKKIIIFLIVFTFVIFPVFSQNRTYFGPELGAKWDLYSLNDPGNYMNNTPIATFYSGFVFGHEFKKNLFIETGINLYQHIEDINFKPIPGYASVTGMKLLQVPLRIKYSLPIIGDRVFLNPSLGIIAAYNDSYNKGGYGGIKLVSETTSVSIAIVPKYDYARILGFGEAGLGLSYRLRSLVEYTIHGRYVQGIQIVTSSDWTYQINDEQAIMASKSSRGSHFSLQGGVYIPISNFWASKGEGKSARERYLKNIEDSSEKDWYITGRFGFASQSNHDNSDNMIQAPTFIGNSVISEILLGYRFYNNWIIETGLGTHQLSHGYSINRDHGFGHGSTSSTGGVDYVGIPLRIKHQFGLINNRFTLSPYIGLTNMISFKEGQQGAGGESHYSRNDEPETITKTTRFIDRKYGILIGGGATFEYRLNKTFSLVFNGERNYGLHKLSHVHVEHQVDEQTYLADIFNRGSGFKFSTGIKIAMGKSK